MVLVDSSLLDSSLCSPFFSLVSFAEVDILATVQANRDFFTLKGWPLQTDVDNTLDDLSCDKRNHIVLKFDNDVAASPGLFLASLLDAHYLLVSVSRIFLYN